ncbi:MAG TPA: hypothetical protein VFO71_06030 [Gemmatimonadales bacterium]|nr:hypothetical protein [Gemmatimonadales bacterium]
MLRPTPYDLVFKQSAPEVFPNIRIALGQAGYDPTDRDSFLMVREVVTLLHDLRPEGGLGEGIDQLAALVHHAYLFWAAGTPAFVVTREQLNGLLMTPEEIGDDIDQPTAYYVSLPPQRIWAEVVPGQPPEPLDGCFVHASGGGAARRVLGVFGIHPEREGFSVVEAVGPQPAALERPDGTELFSPTLAGGKAAGLFSITGAEELLELGWRTGTVAGAATGETGRWRA